MKFIMFLLMMSILIPSIMLSLNFMLTFSKNKNREKMTPFECGFNPNNSPRYPFSIQFFMITLLFLIFDIEIMLLIPFIMLFKFMITMSSAMILMMFLIMLIIGLWLEWSFGCLEWIN